MDLDLRMLPPRTSLLLHCVSLLSFCFTMEDHLLSGAPFVLISEKPFLTICTVQGFVHMGLKSLIGEEGIYLNGSADFSSDLC